MITITRIDGQTIAKRKRLQFVQQAYFEEWLGEQGKYDFRLHPITRNRAYLSFDGEQAEYIVEGAIDDLL